VPGKRSRRRRAPMAGDHLLGGLVGLVGLARSTGRRGEERAGL